MIALQLFQKNHSAPWRNLFIGKGYIEFHTLFCSTATQLSLCRQFNLFSTAEFGLKEYIELDEGFFETSDRRDETESHKKKKGNQGSGGNRQSKVLVAVETAPRTEQEVRDGKTSTKQLQK
jgi:hypothetical protein